MTIRPRVLRNFLLIAIPACISLPAQVSADAVTDFYGGRQITQIIPTGPGAGFDLFGRVLREALAGNIPGKPTIVPKFMPGGGGVRSMAYMFNVAPNDGGTFALANSGAVLQAVLRDTKYDPRKLDWLGSMFPRTAVMWIMREAPATTLDGLRKTEVVVGSSGKGSGTYQMPKLMNTLLGTKMKIITGYKGGARINLAMEGGEVMGRMNNWLGWIYAGKLEWRTSGRVIPVLQMGPKVRELANVPSFRDLVPAGEQRRMVDLLAVTSHIGMAIYFPPGAPRAFVNALRRAFDATMKDKQYISEAEKYQMVVAPTSGEALQKLIVETLNAPEPVVRRFKAALR